MYSIMQQTQTSRFCNNTGLHNHKICSLRWLWEGNFNSRLSSNTPNSMFRLCKDSSNLFCISNQCNNLIRSSSNNSQPWWSSNLNKWKWLLVLLSSSRWPVWLNKSLSSISLWLVTSNLVEVGSIITLNHFTKTIYERHPLYNLTLYPYLIYVKVRNKP